MYKMGKQGTEHRGENIKTLCRYTITYNWKDNNGIIQSSTVTGTASASGESSNTAITNLHKTMDTMIDQSHKDMQSSVSSNCTPNDPECGCSGPQCDCCTCIPYPIAIEYTYL